MPRVRPVSHAGCTWTGLAPEQLPSETIRGSEKMGPVAYFSLCLLGCLIFNPSLEGVQGVACPRSWLPFHDSCYRYVPQEKTWMEAEVRGWGQRGSGALGWSWRLGGWGGLG
nr:C-type lectin lectoxin-Enh1-like [Chrysemys picta bellii]